MKTFNFEIWRRLGRVVSNVSIEDFLQNIFDEIYYMKLDKSRKLCYLFLDDFWQVVPNIFAGKNRD